MISARNLLCGLLLCQIQFVAAAPDTPSFQQLEEIAREDPSAINLKKAWQVAAKTPSTDPKSLLERCLTIASLAEKNVNEKEKHLLVQMNIVVPRGAHYPAGIAPSEITDKKIRDEYEKALARNRKNAALVGRQVDLANFIESAKDTFKRYVLPSVSTETVSTVKQQARKIWGEKVAVDWLGAN